ncbi:MAG: hypothetical protein EXS37_08165 [Opitutus sp.]|nr:hypothetical protein [Opitutus sp.]
MKHPQSKLDGTGESRRGFILKTAAAAAWAGTGALAPSLLAQKTSGSVAIVPDAAEKLTKQPAVQWAIEKLRTALEARQISARVVDRLADTSTDQERIVVSGFASALARPLLAAAKISIPAGPEALGVVRTRIENQSALLVCGSDERGIVYGLLELADEVQHAEQPLAALRQTAPVAERPANPMRSVGRVFLSREQDKAWFDDRNFWSRYLTMLVTHRFNRFQLMLGMGYDAPRDVRDSYFNFAYPFFLSVPGYNVAATGLPTAERDQNLAMLRWISNETSARGLHFQLGLWNQGYEYSESPNANYLVTGLDAKNHAAYCRDGLRQLLESCPAIQGVTLRCHSESGVHHGVYEFWPTVFDGVARCGRRVEIDIHGKGIEHQLLDYALKTGQPVSVSPKYAAEHMGLPYHQTSIQEKERFRPVAGQELTVEKQRSFTRYGYGDYLREDRAYGVRWRIWPATQRLLLWGDPVLAAGFGRLSTFCGSHGMELMEPLSLKGRRGAALGRETYADPSLRPPGGDWEKYLYTYRLWGRLLYNPEANPNSWRRYLRTEFGAAARDCEEALANASRILPLMTMAHMTSPSVGAYWPEIHTSTPIHTRRFGNVGALDPHLFATVNEFADELVSKEFSGRRKQSSQSDALNQRMQLGYLTTGKYSPLQVAHWLERLAQTADTHLQRAGEVAKPADSPAFRRLRLDVAVQSGIGHHLAHKLRAGVAFALAEILDDPAALKESIKHYKLARANWAGIIKVTKGAYKDDLIFDVETRPYLRGSWADRLPAIDEDIAKLEELSREKSSSPTPRVPGKPTASELFKTALASAAAPPRRPCEHVPPHSFRRGEPVVIEMSVPSGPKITRVRLHYRHVNHAEEVQVTDFVASGTHYRQTIPGAYTDSPYPLFYFFELRDSEGSAWFSPGLAPDLSNQPYYVLRSQQTA